MALWIARKETKGGHPAVETNWKSETQKFETKAQKHPSTLLRTSLGAKYKDDPGQRTGLKIFEV